MTFNKYNLGALTSSSEVLDASLIIDIMSNFFKFDDDNIVEIKIKDIATGNKLCILLNNNKLEIVEETAAV